DSLITESAEDAEKFQPQINRFTRIEMVEALLDRRMGPGECIRLACGRLRPHDRELFLNMRGLGRMFRRDAEAHTRDGCCYSRQVAPRLYRSSACAPAGGLSPSLRYAFAVATRPCGVRLMYPSMIKYGSFTSSRVPASSPIATASEFKPTGPPLNLWISASMMRLSHWSKPSRSISSIVRARSASSAVILPSAFT